MVVNHNVHTCELVDIEHSWYTLIEYLVGYHIIITVHSSDYHNQAADTLLFINLILYSEVYKLRCMVVSVNDVDDQSSCRVK